jgi:hypothetical protein
MFRKRTCLCHPFSAVIHCHCHLSFLHKNSILEAPEITWSKYWICFSCFRSISTKFSILYNTSSLQLSNSLDPLIVVFHVLLMLLLFVRKCWLNVPSQKVAINFDFNLEAEIKLNPHVTQIDNLMTMMLLKFTLIFTILLFPFSSSSSSSYNKLISFFTSVSI